MVIIGLLVLIVIMCFMCLKKSENFATPPEGVKGAGAGGPSGNFCLVSAMQNQAACQRAGCSWDATKNKCS